MKVSVLLRFMLCAALLLTVYGEQQKAKTRNVTIGNKVYYRSNNALPWQKAFDFCTSINKKLHTLDNSDDYLALRRWVVANENETDQFWTSARVENGTWRWKTNGKTFDSHSEFWTKGYPRDGVAGKMQCLIFSSKWDWQDELDCDSTDVTHLFFCQ